MASPLAVENHAERAETSEVEAAVGASTAGDSHEEHSHREATQEREVLLEDESTPSGAAVDPSVTSGNANAKPCPSSNYLHDFPFGTVVVRGHCLAGHTGRLVHNIPSWLQSGSTSMIHTSVFLSAQG